MNAPRRFGGIAGVALGIALLAVMAGCTSAPEESRAAQSAREECGGPECHDGAVDSVSNGPHETAGCVACHPDADGAHSDDPDANEATIVWAIDGCAGCHAGEAVTYLYDDNAQPGPFGGSQREPAQPKADTFPLYKDIMAGHPFTKDYNEEGAHAYLLEDHYATTRGKFETCVQCKSTKVAYAWLTGKEMTVAEDTEITLTHTKTATTPAKKLTIPAGTKVTWKTDWTNYQVDAKAVFPDGTTYTSRPTASQDATANFNAMWASTIAVAEETAPYGAGCNHCHDPHSGEPRIVRAAMLNEIETRGVNPYATEKVTDLAKASGTDRQVLLCAQCHVEYTCGKSGVDGIDRDYFSWSKAADLVPLYTDLFGFKQDWKQKTTGQPMHKSQHPETELFWNSVHYNAGASCTDCHMPEVRDHSGRIFRSHWFTSPYKYQNSKLFAAFADSTGLDTAFNDRPCDRCHDDRQSEGVAQQTAVYERQKKVQELLAAASSALAAAGPENTSESYAGALASYRQAQALWENLIVSENSMGFHNYEEVMAAMAEAEQLAADALAKAKTATK